jgi:hypothetical protein
LSDSALIGTSRLQYVDVPEMEVAGIGAYTWKTRSGYEGLTLLFWSNTTQEFLSWSEARPAGQQFDPRQRFFAEGPWDGTQSPKQAASSVLRLRNARRTASGRISGSAKTSALVVSPTAPQSLTFGDRLFTSWVELHDYALRLQPLGLRDSNPLERVVLLEPAFFDAKAYDSITQTLTWDVYDDSGQRLRLSLPFEDWSKDAIRTLEALTPPAESCWKVVANLAIRDDGLEVQPVSFMRSENNESPVFNLAFDATPRQSLSTRPSPATEPNDDENAELAEPAATDETIAVSGYLNRVLTEFEQLLESVAEAGTSGGINEQRQWFSLAQVDMHRAGLTALAAVTSTLANPSTNIAAGLLRARYFLHLYAQASARCA